MNNVETIEFSTANLERLAFYFAKFMKNVATRSLNLT